MAPEQNTSGPSNGTSRPSRPKVVQPKPTNKGAPAPQASSARPEASASRPTAPVIQNAPAQSSTTGSRPGPRIVMGAGSGSTILVNKCQHGNPLLSRIRSVGWEYSAIVPDYQVGTSTCCLFLSIKYHRVHPDYIHSRISKLAGMYNLRLLLVFHDIDSAQNDLKELTKVSIVNDLTIIVAWTFDEAARYLESYKMYEFKGADMIRERAKTDYFSQMVSFLTNVRGVNKTDALFLMSRFGSLRRIVQATPEELSRIPGFGEIKVKRLREAFTTPFRVGDRRTFHERRAIRMSAEGGGAARESGAESAGQTGSSELGDADGPTALAQAREAVADSSTELNANGKRGTSERSLRDESLGPDFDFGADFDLDEEELALLEGGNTASSSEATRNNGQQPAAASGAEFEAQRELEEGTGAAEDGGDGDLGDMLDDFEDEELTAEEREELKRALLLSQSDPDTK